MMSMRLAGFSEYIAPPMANVGRSRRTSSGNSATVYVRGSAAEAFAGGSRAASALATGAGTAGSVRAGGFTAGTATGRSAGTGNAGGSNAGKAITDAGKGAGAGASTGETTATARTESRPSSIHTSAPITSTTIAATGHNQPGSRAPGASPSPPASGT